MKKQVMRLSAVGECLVKECAYNSGSTCNARAITVGDGIHPQCDTFVAMPQHTAHAASPAAVGACKVTACRHNAALECNMVLVRIGKRGAAPECLTFAARP